MSKKIAIGPRPSAVRETPRPDADKWVQNRAPEGSEEETARLTIDVPISLHKRLKAHCAMEGQRMNQVIRSLIERHLSDGA